MRIESSYEDGSSYWIELGPADKPSCLLNPTGQGESLGFNIRRYVNVVNIIKLSATESESGRLLLSPGLAHLEKKRLRKGLVALPGIEPGFED